MSQEVSQVRINASKVSTMLKQGSLLAAVQAVRKATHMLATQPLIRAEQDDFRKLVEQGCSHLGSNRAIRTLFPLTIDYTAGEENALLETLDSLIDALHSDASEEAQKKIEEMARIKAEQLAKGQKELGIGQITEAGETFTKLKNTFPTDMVLVYDIATSYMDAGYFDEAVRYFDNAHMLAPNSVSMLNRMGIAMRKMRRFDLAEAKLLSAISIDDKDANLHFNLGRVYLEWGKLKEGLESATKACAIDPTFDEARKLGVYLQRKLQGV